MDCGFLKEKYPDLNERQFKELINKLTQMHFSEMLRYYIIRYVFYEGHTKWRADPITIGFPFGLHSLTEMEEIFQGE